MGTSGRVDALEAEAQRASDSRQHRHNFARIAANHGYRAIWEHPVQSHPMKNSG